MWCSQCQRDLSVCVCDDLAERLAKLRAPGVRVALTWCDDCNTLAARCMIPGHRHETRMPTP